MIENSSLHGHMIRCQQCVLPITLRRAAKCSVAARSRSRTEQATWRVRAFRLGRRDGIPAVDGQCTLVRSGRSSIAARAPSATQAGSQQPKVLLSAAQSLFTQTHLVQRVPKPCFLVQGTSSGFLTVLSNSSHFLPYAVVASALLAL